MPRVKHVVNNDYVGNDREDIPMAQLRKERCKKWVRTPSPQPIEAEVQDEVEFEGDYGLMLVRTRSRNPIIGCLILIVIWIRLDRPCRPWLTF
jgi:hypothetical protein